MSISKRQRRIAAKEEFKQPVSEFVELNLSESPFVPNGMTRAFRNNRYTVMIYEKARVSTGYAIRAMIQRHDDKPIPNHWSEMQKIKNKVFGEEIMAIEYYPAQSELVDQHNIYWLWLFEKGEIPIPIV